MINNVLSSSFFLFFFNNERTVLWSYVCYYLKASILLFKWKQNIQVEIKICIRQISIFIIACILQISAFMLAFNKRKRKEVKLPLFGKRNDRAFGSIILDTHHPILISFHYETIYNLPLGSRIIRTTLEKSLIDCDWGSPDLPAFERWLLIAKLTFSSTSFSILLSSCIFLFTIQSNHSIRSSEKFLSYL